jgi:ribosome-binding factor A
MSDGRRPARVAERVKEYLAECIQRDLSDPRLMGVGITRVEVPPDLSVAIVYVRHYFGGDAPNARKNAVRALHSAGGRLRRGLGPALGVKRLPELRFEYDTGPDATQRVEELLHEIRSERDPGDETN